VPENIRLLACKDCKTIEELPDYEGDPHEDHLLHHLTSKHRTDEHPHIGQLFDVEKDKWQDQQVQQQVMRQISDRFTGGETGLGSEYYDIKDTYTADALHCWGQHRRDPNCSDYKSDSKRLTPDTASERKQAGLPPYRSNKDRYLCEFCPVHSLVMAAAHDRAGH
jgi:hypothetical protein